MLADRCSSRRCCSSDGPSSTSSVRASTRIWWPPRPVHVRVHPAFLQQPVTRGAMLHGPALVPPRVCARHPLHTPMANRAAVGMPCTTVPWTIARTYHGHSRTCTYSPISSGPATRTSAVHARAHAGIHARCAHGHTREIEWAGTDDVHMTSRCTLLACMK